MGEINFGRHRRTNEYGENNTAMWKIALELIKFMPSTDLNSSSEIFAKFPNYALEPREDRILAETVVNEWFCTTDSEENNRALLPTAFTDEIPPFTRKELYNAISRLDDDENDENSSKGKSSGPDGFQEKTVKMLGRRNKDELLALLNACLTRRVFPDVWKRAVLITIPKNDGKFRPICLFDVLGKAFARMVYNRLYKFLEAGGSLSERQYAYRRGRSADMAVERVGQLKTAALGAGCVACLGVCLDVFKAFDRIPNATVIDGLAEQRVPEYLQNVIRSFLTNRRLIYNGHEVNVYAGVPQGSVLAPLLWNIGVNSVVNVPLPQHTELVVYADDFILVAGGSSVEETFALAGEATATINSALIRAGMEFSQKKTKAVWLHIDDNLNKPDSIAILGNPINIQTSISYLGKVIGID